MKKLLLLIILCSVTSCSLQSEVRCAYVYIYNPKTGTESDLDLKVEIQDNKIVKIFWENGGWLDSSHFNTDNAVLFDDYASFKDDRKRDFGISLQKNSYCEY